MKKSAIDWGTVLRYLAGGMLVGGGSGAGVSALNHLRVMNDQAKRRKQLDTSEDDDVLYINLPGYGKSASAAGTVALSLAGGIGGSMLGYKLIRDLYRAHRKKQLQQELDEAQQVYLGELGTLSRLQKSAGLFESPVSTVTGIGGLALLLTALGSASAVNHILNKQFPGIKNRVKPGPRKIVIRTGNPRADEVLKDPDSVSPDELESIIRTTIANPKTASFDGGMADLHGAAACGLCDQIKDTLINFGSDAMFDRYVGYRTKKASALNRQFAYSWLATDPLVSTAMAPVAASECAEAVGYELVKLAATLQEQDPEYDRDLRKMAELVTVGTRKAAFAPVIAHIKASAADMAIPSEFGTLETALLSRALRGVLSDDEDKKLPTHQEVSESVDSDDDIPVEITDDNAKSFYDYFRKDIDNALLKV